MALAASLAARCSPHARDSGQEPSLVAKVDVWGLVTHPDGLCHSPVRPDDHVTRRRQSRLGQSIADPASRSPREANDALYPVDPLPNLRRGRMVDEAGVAAFVDHIQPTP